MDFVLSTELRPSGDQPKAIKELAGGVESGSRFQTLLGVTGSGKTYTMANVIENAQKPALVIAHNKTLAAQLYSEFAAFFPQNAVEYFVSYYDYYQPEAYLPQTDTYISKDVEINEQIEKLRHSATRSLLSRRDTLVVASVSCIYGLGDPKDYTGMSLSVSAGDKITRKKFIAGLVGIRYDRNDVGFTEGEFRVRGAFVDVLPPYEDDFVRVRFGDGVEAVTLHDRVTGKKISELSSAIIYPAKHYVIPEDKRRRAIEGIRAELAERLSELKSIDKLLEAQRIQQRTSYDLEMIENLGYCSGIENYSLYLSGRKSGEPPYTLLDYFPKDYLLFIDESHMTVPQIRGMYAGDRSRKETLVDHGFRLPSALDNRPLRFDEFLARVSQCVFVSATPAAYEIENSEKTVEQVIRPTGLLDPEVGVRKTEGQIDDLVREINARVGRRERVIVTTLTKRMAEDLADYLGERGLRVRYLHSEIDTLDRVDILRDLRLGEFDVVVGINLLREGIDLPEVTLVAILDADREGFLRSETSLVQTIGRASRNVNGKVLLYADSVTDSMRKALRETTRRRQLQLAYNKRHGITPQTIRKAIRDRLVEDDKLRGRAMDVEHLEGVSIKELTREMNQAAEQLDFERAAKIRDLIREKKKK